MECVNRKDTPFRKVACSQFVLIGRAFQVGSVVKGKITKVTARGLIVALTDNGRIRGFVPLLHLADVKINKPQAKFKVAVHSSFSVV